MGYTAVCRWRDLTDGHLYNAGDDFPFDGREIPPARLRELSTSENNAQITLIQAVEEKPEESVKPASKTRQNARKRQRKGEEHATAGM